MSEISLQRLWSATASFRQGHRTNLVHEPVAPLGEDEQMPNITKRQTKQGQVWDVRYRDGTGRHCSKSHKRNIDAALFAQDLERDSRASCDMTGPCPFARSSLILAECSPISEHASGRKYTAHFLNPALAVRASIERTGVLHRLTSLQQARTSRSRPRLVIR